MTSDKGGVAKVAKRLKTVEEKMRGFAGAGANDEIKWKGEGKGGCILSGRREKLEESMSNTRT